MKTSLDLPDDLYRRVKAKSALEGRAVREVAAALFSAWVEGRATAPAAEQPVAAGPLAETDPRRQWLARWHELTAKVMASSGGSPGLVDQLGRDRR